MTTARLHPSVLIDRTVDRVGHRQAMSLASHGTLYAEGKDAFDRVAIRKGYCA